VITNVGVSNITETGATITWTVSAQATGQVEYGTTAEYGLLSTLEDSFVYSTHVQRLSGLSAGTLYHYRARSTDAAGNTAQSADQTFTTSSPIPSILPTPIPTSTPPPSTSTLTSATTPNLPRPGYLAPIVDPTWGTSVVRITAWAGVRHAYSRTPAWNSDQSKILLGFLYPGRMLDGTTYADLGSFPQVSYASWANTDPNKIYGTSGNKLVSQNATTAAVTTLHTFTGYSTISIGDGEGAIDDNDRFVALLAVTTGGAQHLIVYDIALDSVVATLALPSRPDNAEISRKGNYVTIGWLTDGTGLHQGIERYNRALTSRINLTPYGRHGDNALDANGNEIYVANSPYVDSFLLSTGASTRLLSGRTAFEWGHVSGRNIQRPGWIYLSVFDNTATIGRAGRDQVIAVRTDGSGIIEPFGFEHHQDTTHYAMQPQAVPAPDGRRVLFASEWGGTEIHTYVAAR
jgi:hypothetical protein